MDLAKIRKKSLQRPSDPVDSGVSQQSTSPSELNILPGHCEDADLAPLLSTTSRQLLQSVETTSAVHAEPSMDIIVPHIGIVPTMTPLEAILSSRAAAGCNDDAFLAEDKETQDNSDVKLEFLCFRVSDEIYGINIMEIKEIIKSRDVTEVPRVPAFVSGILSLRGTIIPIIDMRIRLGLARNEFSGKERIIVIKNSNALSGLLVDEVIQVVQVPADSVEAAPTVLDGIDRDFVSGIGRANGKLIIILHLENIADIQLY